MFPGSDSHKKKPRGPEGRGHSGGGMGEGTVTPEGCKAGCLLLFPAPPFLLPPPHGGEVCSGGDGVVFQIPLPLAVSRECGLLREGAARGWLNKKPFPIPEVNWRGSGRIWGPCRKVDGQFPPSRGRAVGLGAPSPGQPWVPCVLGCVKAGGIWGWWGLRYSISGGHT